MIVYRASRLELFTATILFAVLFPGFFAYHYLTTIGFVGTAGGYTGAASAFVGSVSAIALVLHISAGKTKINYIDVVFLAAIVWKLAIALLFYSSADYEYSAEQSLNGLIIYTLLYLSLRYLLQFRKRLRAVFMVFLAAMLVLSVAALDQRSFAVGANPQTVTYQSFALFLLFTGFISMLETNGLLRLSIGGLVVAVLFFIGARTEFFIAFVFIAALSASRHRALVMLAAIGFSMLVESQQIDSYIRDVANANNRIMNFLEYGAASGSYVERQATTEAALETIKQRPLSGAFASYPPGQYSHNMLSAWVDYGLVGFLLHILVFFAGFMELYRRRFTPDRTTFLVGTMLGLCLIAEITFKSSSYFLTPMVLSYVSTLSANPASARRQRFRRRDRSGTVDSMERGPRPHRQR